MCVLSVPQNFDFSYGSKSINGQDGEVTTYEGKSCVKRDDVVVDDGFSCLISIHGQSGLEVSMDVYVGGEVRENDVEAEEEDGNYVMRYSSNDD